jgi:hypothetical protein
MTSQWELMLTLPFPSCFSYNPKFPASLLFGLPPAFMPVSCLAYLTLEDGDVMVLQNNGYIPEGSIL